MVEERNPVTSETVTDLLSKICPGITLTKSELDDYTSILAATHDNYQAILEREDWNPPVDISRFPRENVRYPTKEEDPHGIWAWKCSIKDHGEKASKGLLAGKRICYKDNVAIKDVPCLLGTDMVTGWTPMMDATVVTRVLEAGGEIIGKAVCENMSSFGASFSAATGPISNVYAEGYSAGGSSSGCGVAVARGEADMAIGCDQGGSVRLPASHSGIVGLKPTFGLVPYTGIASGEHFVDYTGPMAKTVMDAALLLQVLAGSDHLDGRQLAGCPLRDQVPDYPALTGQGIKGFKIGILKESLTVKTTDNRVAALVKRAALKFADMGAQVEEVSVPDHVLGPGLWAIVRRLGSTAQILGRESPRRGHVMNDLLAKFDPWTAEMFSKAFPSIHQQLLSGLYAVDYLPATLLGKATNLILKLAHDYDAVLSKYDILITPTLPWLPKTWAPINASPKEKLDKCSGLGLNVCPFNATGHPGISIPVGFLSSLEDAKVSLPVGMQIVSRWYGEDKILRAAHAWEQAINWKLFANAS